MRWKREHYLAAFIPFFAFIAIFVMVANDATDDVSDNIVLSIAASTSALSLMALNLFLSIRLRVSEKVFGGLDKQYFFINLMDIASSYLCFFIGFWGLRVARASLLPENRLKSDIGWEW